MEKDVYIKLQNGSDVRGIAITSGSEIQNLTPEIVKNISAAFASFVSNKYNLPCSDVKIGVGHDSRLSAESLKNGVIQGVQSRSSICLDCGLVSTPSMFMSTILEACAFHGAIMITASHLPFNRNGLKFFTKEGGLESKDIKAILEMASNMEDNGVETSYPSVEQFDLIHYYAEHIKNIIKKEVQAEDYEYPLKGLHIVVDAGNGACGFFTREILEPLGADTSGSVFLSPDGSFPNHIPNPENEEAMAAIQKATLESKADLGVIFDCDGDRAAVVMNDGQEVNRNALIALMAAIVAEQYPNTTVVTDSVTSDYLTDFLENTLHMKHLRFKRGYKNVINESIRLNNIGEESHLAIETSGHGALKENHFSDDGAYMSVKIICKMAKLKRENKDLQSLIAKLQYPKESVERRLSIQIEEFKTYGKQVLKDFIGFAEQQPTFHIVKDNYEGVRVSFHDEEVSGWILVRMSLHDPIIPINIEANEDGGVEVILNRVKPFFATYDKLSSL